MRRKRDMYRPRRAGAVTLAEWKVLSRQVFERDSWRCVLPDCTKGLGELQCHHVVARSGGGRDEMSNLVSLHARGCHDRVQKEWCRWVPAFEAYLRGVAKEAG